MRNEGPSAEGDLERAKHGDAASAPTPRRPWILIPVLMSLAGGVAYLLLGGDDPLVYSRTVTEVVTDTGSLRDQALRVEGALTEGSIRFREDPCEWRFTLEEGEHHMPVEFARCVVPDTFRDHMGITVVVEGRVREDGTFVASDVIPRCPSRYEMDERAARGETMPHAPGGPPGAAPLTN
jgi:cytochrome c-type biogenesis protein CcmE